MTKGELGWVTMKVKDKRNNVIQTKKSIIYSRERSQNCCVQKLRERGFGHRFGFGRASIIHKSGFGRNPLPHPLSVNGR